MIHIIASDVDGTMLPEGTKHLNPRYYDLINKLLDNGLRFVAASGRQYPNLRRLFGPVADRIDYICENGSLVVCRGQIIRKNIIDRTFGQGLLWELLHYRRL